MRGFNIGEQSRRGEYCDICKKTIYLNIWGHVEMHRRELQRQEDQRERAEAGERFKEQLFGKCPY